ncbi:putative protein kinase RLK-Pelle-DLSV family [Helianthus anomalus]
MLVSILFLWMPILIFTATAYDFKTKYCELNTTSQTNNTIYYSNLIQVLDSLASESNLVNKLFLAKSTGIQPDIVYGLYLCRADVLPNDCRNCLLDARDDINTTCPLSKAVVTWRDTCMLRYANYSMVSVMNSATFFEICNEVNISELASEQHQFSQVANYLMGQLSKRASNDLKKMFAYDEVSYNDTEKIYGYVQCTPDLTGSDCSKCLQESIDRLRPYCYGKKGARLVAASCNVRFEIYKFLQFTTASSDNSDESDIIAHESLQFEFGTIEEATNNFSIENKVGEGGFGEVYKGILANGQEIAVKRLSKGSRQGSLEFKNEVVLLAKLQHRNLVRLLGFCLHAEERILIYEYVPNNSLDFFLFGPTNDVKLDWSTRYRIIGGIARGMLYLHEDSRLRIVHRDLKTSNILLDQEMNPKISDFGIARIVCGSEEQAKTSRIVGTFGYMSPEYAMHGHFSVKSDVYSFGVLLLEIISGKKNTRFFQPAGYTDLLCFAWSKWKCGEKLEILDTNMVDSSSENEALRCINIALLCVQEDDELRPSMASVVFMLNSDSDALPVPQHPPFVSGKRSGHTTSELQESVVWLTDASLITDVHPR